jgi:hypothetical protein
MPIIQSGRELILETNVNNICFQHVSAEGLVDFCEIMWGEATDSCLVCIDGKLFVNDGVDPTTGKKISDEAINLIKAQVNWLAWMK